MRNSYYFALSAAAAAAVVAGPGTAKAVCECTFKQIAPGIIKTTGPENIVYGGSASAGYDAVISQDTMYGFTGTNTPAIWLDYWLSSAGTYTTTATICRVSYLGTQIACAPAGTDTVTVTGSTGKEMAVPVTGTFGRGGSNSAWDRVKMHVSSPYSAFNPMSIPARYNPTCW
jgi:hypothetical protein